MEPRDRAAEDVTDEPVEFEPAAPTLKAVWRFRLAACCLALVALAFAQAPGQRRDRHQARPDGRPGGLPGPRAAPVGLPGCLRAGAEPGVRLPVPDGSVLRARATFGPAAVGHPAAVVVRCSWSSRSSASSAARRAADRQPLDPDRGRASRSPCHRGMLIGHRARLDRGVAVGRSRRGCWCRWSSACSAADPRRHGGAEALAVAASAGSTRRPRSRWCRWPRCGCWCAPRSRGAAR